MHVAAMKPTVARVEDVDPAKAEAERAKLTAEAKASGKPDNIVSKIVDGKMKSSTATTPACSPNRCSLRMTPSPSPRSSPKPG